MSTRRARLGAALRLLLSAAVALLLLALTGGDVARWRHDRRGIENGAAARLAAKKTASGVVTREAVRSSSEIS